MRSICDIVGAAVLALLGCAALLFGANLPVGQLRVPGSGALPLFSGAIVLLLSLALLLRGARGLRRGARERPDIGSVASTVDAAAAARRGVFGAGQARTAVVILLIGAYAWTLPRGGYLLTTACLMTTLFGLARPHRRWVAPALGVAGTLFTYALFHLLLKVPLPHGSWWDS